MAIDIGNIKTQFKSIMDSFNATSAAYDLSTGLTTRVQKVFKVNPIKIPIQATLFPYVTIYPTDKEIDASQIARDQLTAKRIADVGLNIVGAVWEPNNITVDSDPADDQIEKLMENVEEVLRRNFKLNGAVEWTRPEKVSYHTYPIDEQTHMRVGLLEIVAKITY